MNQCHNCGQSLPDVNATSCEGCGTIIADNTVQTPKDTDDQDLDFVVTEAASSDPEFVGGAKKFKTSDSEDLGIESTLEATLNRPSPPIKIDASQIDDFEDDEDGPIGESAPILPEPQEIDQPISPSHPENTPRSDSPKFQGDSTDKVHKLSDDDVKKIEQDLYGSNSYISKHDKSNLLNKISQIPEQPPKKPVTSPPSKNRSSKSSDPSDKELTAPKMVGMGRGAALFYKNYLHVPAIQEFYDGDELIIGGREYLLRPKKFNTRLIIGAASLLFAAILFFVGSLFIGNVGGGLGHVVGVVYNLDGSTNIKGASIRFPDLNLTVKSDVEGFFKSGTMPSGPHQVEYILNGKVAMTDYVTVFNEQVSTINLFPRQPAPKTISSSKPSRKQNLAQKQMQPPQKTTTQAQEKTVAEKPKKKTSSSQKAKIKLESDVEGARFTLDSKVLGAGNLTYSRLNPGKHSYTVSKDGYYDRTGKISLVAGKTFILEVSLDPMEMTEKEVTFDYEDFYYSGVTALNEGDLDRAINDLNEAIDREPSYTDAYLARGKAFLKLKQKRDAHDNFLRAAEILVFRKNYNHAITAYNNALKANSKSVPALLGRGQTYLSQGQEIAAVADFETAKKYDKRNFAAYFGIGEARFKQGNYKKAIDGFKKARSLNSNHPLVHQYLMLSYLARDDFKNVKKSFDKFKKSASDDEYNSFLADKKSDAIMQIVENR